MSMRRRRPYKKVVGPITVIHAESSDTAFWTCLCVLEMSGPAKTWAAQLNWRSCLDRMAGEHG